MPKYRVFYDVLGAENEICHVDVMADWKSDAMIAGNVVPNKILGDDPASRHVLDAITAIRLPQMWWDEFATQGQRIADISGALVIVREYDQEEYRTPAVILKRSVEYAKRDWKYLPASLKRALKRGNLNYMLVKK